MSKKIIQIASPQVLVGRLAERLRWIRGIYRSFDDHPDLHLIALHIDGLIEITEELRTSIDETLKTKPDTELEKQLIASIEKVLNEKQERNES